MTMGQFIVYTFQAGLVLLGCYLAYKWLISWRNEPRFSRAIILGCYIVSLIVPFMEFHGSAADPAAVPGGIELGVPTVELSETGLADRLVSVWPVVKWVYLIGLLLTFAATVVAWLRIARIVARGRRSDVGGYKVVVVDDDRLSPMSWMGYIIVNRRDYGSEAFRTIATHEIAHLRLRHTLDLVVAQVFIIAMWYNPASWLMARELRAVHEYQADKRVLEGGVDARGYQLLLVKKAVGSSFPALANSMNHSNLKKRITMMQKSKSSKMSRLSALAIVPAIALAVFVTRVPAIAGGLESLSRSSVVVADTSDDKVTQKKQEEAKPYQILKEAENMPKFPGGDAAMLQFIAENIKYPDSELDRDGVFTVVVRFTIGADGKVVSPEVVRSQGEAFDNAALDVVNKLPDFEPGTVDGKPVSVSYTLPVRFKSKKDAETK